jgi:hypothetical protein
METITEPVSVPDIWDEELSPPQPMTSQAIARIPSAQTTTAFSPEWKT